MVLRTGAAGSTFALIGCGREPIADLFAPRKARAERGLFYDTYAMALYFDGGLGPKTGIIAVSYLLANEPITLDFWHGHGGKLHAYTVTPDHFAQMRKRKKVTLETTIVDSHSHKLFIDVTDVRYRVPGSVGIGIPEDDSGGGGA